MSDSIYFRGRVGVVIASLLFLLACVGCERLLALMERYERGMGRVDEALRTLLVVLAVGIGVLGWTCFGLAIVVGLALDLLGLFGNWIILAAIGLAWLATGFEHFGGMTLPILLGLAVLGEILEALASGVGASRFGGSRGSIGAALVGCILGAMAGSPLLPVVGTLIGAIAGAFVAASLYEYLMRDRTVREAMYVGVGAALGKVGGVVMKLAAGIAMLVVAVLNF